MAGALASALVDEVTKKLASVMGKEWELLESFKGDLDSMKSRFTTIQAVLEDAENRCIVSCQLRDWLKKLKDAADDIAYFLDEIETEEAERREQLQNLSANMGASFALFNPMILKSDNDMAQKMKSLSKRLYGIAKERRDFHLAESAALDRQIGFEGRETISIIDEDEIVGRDKDRENIIKLVLGMNMSNQKNVSVVPVVGIGGLGKTTLAQAVFNDGRVTSREQFDLRLWVCVSDDFSVGAIGEKILSDMNEPCHGMSSQDIAKRVAERLKGKRFLLVLDDVWNEDQDKWDKVKVLFKDGRWRSRILVTTRSEKVAEVMGTMSEPYSLQRLSDDDCWALFKRKAFKEGQERGYPSLAGIGREIVKKCGGVPLAAIALGSRMRHKRTDAEWEAVRDSEIWNLEDDSILPSLKLSYIQMPSGLKHCFAYCSIFPRNHQIDKDNLISQWIALGFIPMPAESTSTEVIGGQYFDDLLSMSFVQELRKDGYTRRLQCKMHDLVHDLARSVAGDEVSVVEADQAITIPAGCRYLSLIGLKNRELSKAEIPEAVTRKLRALHLQESAFHRMFSDKAKSLRVLHLQYGWMTPLFLDSFKGSKLLRYVYLSGKEIKELPEFLSGLHYVHTLSLSDCKFKSLPDSIGRLQSLQNLDLSETGLQTTPKFDVGFQNLQFLDLSRCHDLHTLHESIGCLSKLRTLSFWRCYKLESLPNSLSNLQSLEYLNLGRTLVGALPEDIGSLGNLETLSVYQCSRLQQLPNSIGKLQNLRTLDVSYCTGLRALPPSVSDLLNLEKLDMSGSWGITELPQEMQKMAKLRHLLNKDLHSCNIPRGIGKLANLLTLERYIVGEQGSGEHEYASMADLQHLDHLSGQVAIYGLEKVKDPGEAMRASLQAKHKLRSLTFYWDSQGSRDEKVAEAVLESLQPHRNLEALRIVSYMGSKYPSWMISGNLVDIDLYRCHGVPPLGRLLYLKKLRLGQTDVRQLGSEFCGGNDWASPFPSLEELTLDFHVEEWLTAVTVDEEEGSRQLSAYPRLAKLTISRCENLRPQPCLPTSLVDLSVFECPGELMERLLGPSSTAPSPSCQQENMPRLPNLQRLQIRECKGLVTLPEWLGRLRSLQSVSISSCPDLASLPTGLQQLGDELRIYNCPALQRG